MLPVERCAFAVNGRYISLRSGDKIGASRLYHNLVSKWQEREVTFGKSIHGMPSARFKEHEMHTCDILMSCKGHSCLRRLHLHSFKWNSWIEIMLWELTWLSPPTIWNAPKHCCNSASSRIARQISRAVMTRRRCKSEFLLPSSSNSAAMYLQKSY